MLKEDFGTESKVKVDVSGSEKRVTAIKVHSVEKIESANYPYQRARTTIASRTDLSALLRQTTSSQEWCGITSARIVRSGDHFEHRWDSYFEGEPVGKEALPTDSITDHQLLLLARDFDFQEKKALEFTLLSGMESNKAGPLQTFVNLGGRTWSPAMTICRSSTGRLRRSRCVASTAPS